MFGYGYYVCLCVVRLVDGGSGKGGLNFVVSSRTTTQAFIPQSNFSMVFILFIFPVQLQCTSLSTEEPCYISDLNELVRRQLS